MLSLSTSGNHLVDPGVFHAYQLVEALLELSYGEPLHDALARWNAHNPLQLNPDEVNFIRTVYSGFTAIFRECIGTPGTPQPAEEGLPYCTVKSLIIIGLYVTLFEAVPRSRPKYRGFHPWTIRPGARSGTKRGPPPTRF